MVKQDEIQHALGKIKESTAEDSDNEDDNVSGTPLEILQGHHPKAIVLYGYDMLPLLPLDDQKIVAASVDPLKYVHEYDIFPTVISALQLYNHGSSENSSAEFRMISVWGARTMEPGVHFGYLYVVPEEEIGDYFNST